jgi:hypothetical protein
MRFCASKAAAVRRLAGSVTAAAAGAAALVFLTGCTSLPKLDDGAYHGPFFAPKNYAGDPVLPVSIRRVVLLPVCGGTVAEPESAAALDRVVFAALQQQARFEVVALSREDCRTRFGAPEYSSAAALPPDFLGRIARACAADAVLFVDLTVYRPYRPLSIGFRAKLATVQDVRLVWTFDEVFSAANPEIVNSLRRQNLKAVPSEPALDLTFATLQSPGRYAAFAADLMFRTLPPR